MREIQSDVTGSTQFIGFLYFSTVAPISGHGSPPGRVTFVVVDARKSGKTFYINDKLLHISCFMSIYIYRLLYFEYTETLLENINLENTIAEDERF